ncbi:MAG: hypothetical protein M1817_000319 [Caeruleum heppii]|nr:MAG: hypothetical protein M1817_000319 [Caeruleum heppii]
MFTTSFTVSALVAILPLVSAQASGSGKTTRYWDCCKSSCAWPGKGDVTSPVQTCDVDNNPLTDALAKSGCEGGDAYMCADQTPWAVDENTAYGFAAVSIAGSSEASWCCSCYELTFTSGPASGKKMVVQATNTGADLGDNQFDLAIPGGGVGLFNACTKQYGAPSSGWGAQYGGISSGDSCSTFPEPIKPGCNFRWDFMAGADNPTVDFKEVTCPAALVAKTGCGRKGETPAGGASAGAKEEGPETYEGSASADAASDAGSSNGSSASSSSSTSSSTTAAGQYSVGAAEASSTAAADSSSSPSSSSSSTSSSSASAPTGQGSQPTYTNGTAPAADSGSASGQQPDQGSPDVMTEGDDEECDTDY